MDNRQIDVTSEGDEDLRMALTLIWANAPGGKASYYKIVKLVEDVHYYCDTDGKPYGHRFDLRPLRPTDDPKDGIETLILCWSDEKDAVPLAYPHSLDEAYHFVKGWLRSVKTGSQPDHDGDNGHGWRVFCDHWGHVAGHHYAICGVQFKWAMYGK